MVFWFSSIFFNVSSTNGGTSGSAGAADYAATSLDIAVIFVIAACIQLLRLTNVWETHSSV